MLRKSVSSARDEALSSGMIMKSLIRSSLHEKCSGLLLVELVDVEAGSEWKGVWRAIAKGRGVVVGGKVLSDEDSIKVSAGRTGDVNIGLVSGRRAGEFADVVG